MRELPKVNVKLMTTLIQNNQPYVKKLMGHFLRNYYTDVVETKQYIYATGDIPIALVAHMDTVFEKDLPGTREVFYDRKKGVMFCPQGGGFDDKAGVYAIIQIVKSGLRPHIILTTDEESGCVGGSALAAMPCPFPDLRYIIQLDRRHADDCVFYDCDNEPFIKYVESFGFVEAFGSFTDISVLCPAWKIAGVNLSIGYENEHTKHEVLYVYAMQKTIEKVKNMLKVDMSTVPQFEYIPLAMDYLGAYRGSYNIHQCPDCKLHFFTEEVFPTVATTGHTVYYCPDCLVSNKISWCRKCGRPFQKRSPTDVECVLCAEKE